MATALVQEGTTYEQQVADALRLPPKERALRFVALREVMEAELRRHQAQAVLALARSHGPRDFGPQRHREYNFEAAGRDVGLSGSAVIKMLAAEGLL